MKDYKLLIIESIVLANMRIFGLLRRNYVHWLGGNNLLGNKRQIGDQEFKCDNLGLNNCTEQKVPIRVVSGHKCQISYVWEDLHL